MSDSDSDDCLVLPDPNPNPTEFSLIEKPVATKQEQSSAYTTTPAPKKDPKPTTPSGRDSDTETISTIDLCDNRKKKQNVSLSTYISRPNKTSSLKPQLEKLNSKSTVTVKSMLSRESKRRKIEKTGNKVDTTKIVNLFKSGRTVADIADQFDISKKCCQQIVSNHTTSSESLAPPVPKKRGVPQFPKDPGSLTALRAERPPTIVPSEIRNKITENELKLGRRKSMVTDGQVAEKDSPPKGQQKVKYQCKHCPYSVFNSASPEEKKLHYSRNCLGIQKKIVNIQKEFRDRSTLQVEALNSHFIKQGSVYICAYCQKQCEQWQDCTISVAKYLHLELYHQDKKPEIKRITTMSDIQKIISNSSSATPRLCIKATPSMPMSKKFKSRTQPGITVDPESKWQKPVSKTLPKILKRSNSASQSSDTATCSSRIKTSSTESSDNGMTSSTVRDDQQINRLKRKTSSSSEEELRRVKRPSKSPETPRESIKRPSLSPDSSSRESSPDTHGSSKSKKSKEKEPEPTLTPSDIRRVDEKEDFVRRQYELVNEGPSKKQKCRHCESYFKNLLPTLQLHLKDKCTVFWEKRKRRHDRREAEKKGITQESTPPSKARKTEKDRSREEECVRSGSTASSSSDKRRPRAPSSGSEGRRPRAPSSGSEGRRPRASSTDDEVNAAAEVQEDRDNTLGKEQSEKIVTYKIIKELIAEGLLTDYEKTKKRCVCCSRGYLELASCQHKDMWQWECNKCQQKVAVRKGSVIGSSEITLECFSRLYKEYKAGTNVDVASAMLKLSVGEVKKIYDNIHKEVAADKTKIKPEPVEFGMASGSGTVATPTSPTPTTTSPAPARRSPTTISPKKENYRENTKFECGVVKVKTEPIDGSNNTVFKLDPDGKLCNVHLRTEWLYGEKDRCSSVALLNNTLCNIHDNRIRLKETAGIAGFDRKPKVSKRAGSARPDTKDAERGPSTSAASAAAAADDDEEDLPDPFDNDEDEHPVETEDQASGVEAEEEEDEGEGDNSLHIDEHATPDTDEEELLLEEPAEQNEAPEELRVEQEEEEEVEEVKDGGREEEGDSDDEGIDVVEEDQEEEGFSFMSVDPCSAATTENIENIPTVPDVPITGPPSLTTAPAAVTPAAVTPTVDAATDPHVAGAPAPTRSAASQCEVQVFPKVSEEMKLKHSSVSIFKEETIRRFDLQKWTEDCIRELDMTAGNLSLNHIKEKFEDSTLHDILNQLWLVTLSLNNCLLKKFIGLVVMLHFLEMRMTLSSKRMRHVCDMEIDRALSKLDIFTLLLLHRLALQSDVVTHPDTYTSNRLCRLINTRLCETEPEEQDKVMKMVTSSYTNVDSSTLYNLRTRAHEQKNILSIVAIEQVLQEKYSCADPIEKLSCIKQYLSHLQSLKGDDKLWPDVSELRSYDVTSALRCIAGEVYLAQAATSPPRPGPSNRAGNLLAQLANSLTSEEKNQLVAQLHGCGLVSPVTSSTSGVVGEVSSSEDQVGGVETSDNTVQVNLYESTWMPGPEYDFRQLGPVDRFRINDEIVLQMVALEKVAYSNEAATNENNLLITSLESSLKRRQALKVELDNRDQRIKRHRSLVLAQREIGQEPRDVDAFPPSDANG